MPAYTDHYKNSRQQQHRHSSSSSLPSNPLPVAAQAPAIPTFGGGNSFSSRARIYPREYSSRIQTPKSPHPSNTTSPLLSALQTPGEPFSRSIPFPAFLSSSTPSSGPPNSLGSASGGVGLGVGNASPPPSAPASYSSAGNFSGGARQVRGYPGFEEQYSSHHHHPGHGVYYNPTQRYAQGSPSPLNAHFAPAAASDPHLRPGEGSYACAFDTLDESAFGAGAGAFTGLATSGGGSGGGENVICLGWEGGVDVWKVGRGVVEQVGRLEGLGGGVKSAKILPTPPRDDPLAVHRPLICLVIHSPVALQPNTDAERPTLPLIRQDETPYSTSPPSRPSTAASEESARSQPVEWQTTVEVWSLSSRTRVATLFTSPLVSTANFPFGIGSPPPPWGALRVEVAGTRVVVGVGVSGELYIFGLGGEDGRTGFKGGKAEWRCLGKLWTTVQAHSGGNFPGDGGMSGDGKALGAGWQAGTPVFSLSNGWLAYCPASAGSAYHWGGEIGVLSFSASVKSQTPPTQPSITAAVSLEDEAFINRMAREVTQEVIRGAKWATEAGIKALQSYWNGGQGSGSPPPPAPPLPQNMVNSGMYGMQSVGALGTVHGGPQPSGLGQQLRQMQQMGGMPQQPPLLQSTAHQQSASEPRLVSILDLTKTFQSLDGGVSISGLQSNMIPMATFLPPAGVSYLSFAPGGLALLTASSKGDLLFVWDLMRVVHHPPGNPMLGGQKPASMSGVQDSQKAGGSSPSADIAALGKHIRQIARFSRITPTTVVDVGWSSPRPEKLTVVTERGTVHFYDLPNGAYQWPPLRRPPPSSSAVATGAQVGAAGAAGAAVTGAVNLLNSSTQPLLSAARKRRSRSSSIGSPSGGIFLSGNPSKRAGQSGSGSGSPNDHPGGSKVSLPQGLGSITPGCVKFLVGKERGYVALTGGGVLRIYEVRPGGGGSKKKNAGGIMSNFLEYVLPMLPDRSSQQSTLLVEGEEKQVGGFWAGRHHHHHHQHPVHAMQQQKFEQDPLSFAEIETNAIFPPFHSDRHVSLFVYTDVARSNGLPRQNSRKETVVDWLDDEARFGNHRRRRKSKKGTSTPRSSSSSPSREAPTKRKSRKRQSPVTPPPEQVVFTRIPTAAPSHVPDPGTRWVFGLPIPTEKLNVGSARGEVEFTGDEAGLAEAMESGLELGTGTMRRKGRSKGRFNEGFFEEDCEVLEFTV